MRDFYEEGAKAHDAGKHVTDNPLLIGSAEWDEWREGWWDMNDAYLSNYPEMRIPDDERPYPSTYHTDRHGQLHSHRDREGEQGDLPFPARSFGRGAKVR